MISKFPTPDKFYQSMDMTALCNHSKYSFDAATWLKYFDLYKIKKKENLKLLRQYIQSETLNSFRNLQFTPQPHGSEDFEKSVSISRSSLEQSCKLTKFYSNPSASTCILESLNSPKPFKTNISIMIGDCLEAALIYSMGGINKDSEHNVQTKKVAVLNMASAKRPGGGYKTGSGAQEENLFRRTSLAFSLEDVDHWDTDRKWKYPLPELGGVYVPNVSVIRGSELKGYPFLTKLYHVDVICVAAYAKPQLDQSRQKLHESLIENVKNKMRLMFAMAIENGVTTVILSAWGCGAYENPPSHIASLFNSVIKEYDGAFEDIVFAIYNDHNAKSTDGNIVPFERVFNIKGTEIVWD
ncbi:hypothetical protein C9374_004914 [Naegleria lovaniensis]|uniref:Microbial-type PARG catalytic domain-containing protein n=1 Tax=Naegleria lovaniensis TaxID=51637 RepID=A0AA88GR21_NAELO|nr:uncharacterized protein C9374_004914 [Naegleria lovaniensis]KAG2382947.1 hypothetical protein C9374_004914 [Naegleria lovaniensis]